MSTAPRTPDDSNPSTPSVTASKVGDVVVVQVDDGKANALSFDVLSGIGDALDRATDGGAKAVAIIGRDGKFSAGFDLKIMTGDILEARRLLGTGAELGIRIVEFEMPVVFGVTGHALAMGGILTTCPDYRVGADGPYKIGLNEVAIGMPVPAFAVELCRDRLASKWFTRCLQHARLCTPPEAVEAGFLDEVVTLDRVAERAIEVAQQLADTVQPAAFRMTRRAMRSALAATIRASLPDDLALFDVSTAS